VHEQNLYKAVSGDDDSAADLLRIGNSDGNRNANVKMLIPFSSRSFPFLPVNIYVPILAGIPRDQRHPSDAIPMLTCNVCTPSSIKRESLYSWL